MDQSESVSACQRNANELVLCVYKTPFVNTNEMQTFPRHRGVLWGCCRQHGSFEVGSCCSLVRKVSNITLYSTRQAFSADAIESIANLVGTLTRPEYAPDCLELSLAQIGTSLIG